jgi:hypothetical protein
MRFLSRQLHSQVFDGILCANSKASFVSTFRLEAVENVGERILEVSIQRSGSGIKVEELLALISALQLNTTLKTLIFQPSCFKNISLPLIVNQRSNMKTLGWNV